MKLTCSIIFIMFLVFSLNKANSFEYGCDVYRNQLNTLKQENIKLKTNIDIIKNESESYEHKLRSMIESPNLWSIVKGKWEIGKEKIKYLGADGENNQNGILINNYQRVWQGSIEATVVFQGEGGAHIIFSYHPVSGYYFTAGIGQIFQEKNAFIITQQRNNTYDTIAYFGTKKENITENTEYKVILSINGSEISLTVNGIKVVSNKIDSMIYSDRIGLFAFGNNPVEFKDFKINSIEP